MAEHETGGHPAVERMRDQGRGASGKSAYRAAANALFWILAIGAVLVIAAIYLFFSIFTEQNLVYLSRAPIQARIERVASSSNAAGHCALEVWRLSEESRLLIEREGLAFLTSPHGFAPGWTAAPWREVSGDLGPETPWSASHCPSDARRDFIAWAAERPSYLAVLRRSAEGAPSEAAVFLIGAESGVFARAVFSLRAETPLDPES